MNEKNTKKPLISVIIPIFNTDKYLNECAESVLNQTYTNIEVFLIDDGSTDNSPSICDGFAKKDDRVHVIHKQNGGQSSARNVGLNQASGDYISFIDSDDWVKPDMYSTLINQIQLYDADIAVCSQYFYMGGNFTTSSICTDDTLAFSKKEEFYASLIGPKPSLRFELWNKLIKREIISEIRFKEGQVYEELFFDRMIFSRANIVVYVDKPLYVYRQSRPGNTNSIFKKNRLVKFQELDTFIRELQLIGNDDVVKKYQNYAADSAIHIYTLAFKHGADNESKKIIVENFEKYYNSYNAHSHRQICFHYFPNVYVFVISLLSRMKSFFTKY